MRSWRAHWGLMFLLALLLPACGGASVEGALPVEQPAAPVKPRNAHEIARSLVGGQVDALVFVDRVRNHPLGPRIAALRLWGDVFDGTGLDPLQDLDRAYITAPTIRSDQETVMVGEHHLAQERARAAIDTLVRRSQPPGQWLTEVDVPAARVTVQGHRRVVALVEPNVLVVLPSGRGGDALRFVGTGGCPDPVGPEAVVASAIEPARTMRGAAPFSIPPSLKQGVAVLTPSPDGGADLHVDLQSTSPSQAQADAQALGDSVSRATSVNLGFARIRMFEPIAFYPEQERVKADRHLTRTELDRIFMLVAATLPR